MNLTLTRLLKSGYFPRELPPPFSTHSFSKVAASPSTPLPHPNHRTSRPELFNLARTGTLRRPLSILNPIHFYFLADYVSKNWPLISNHTKQSAFSLSRPTVGTDSRALGRKHRFDSLPERRAALRAQAKFVLRADINRFYPSIYTHSLAWALEGKDWCKRIAIQHASVTIWINWSNLVKMAKQTGFQLDLTHHCYWQK